jgi:hypothetical protein
MISYEAKKNSQSLEDFAELGVEEALICDDSELECEQDVE